MPEVLKAPLVVEFPFTRSLGPVQSAFLTGLRERVVLGVRASDGRILVPPVEYDPVTAEETPRPRRGRPHRHGHHLGLEPRPPPGPAPHHPLRLGPGPPRRRRHRPPARPRRPGPRRRAHRYARPRPLGGGTHRRHHGHRLLRAVRRRPGRNSPRATGEFEDPVTGIVAPARLDYTYSPGRAQTAYINALGGRRTVGERCPSCRKVYVPPRGACPTCGVATSEQVEVGPRGTVTTFCIVNIKAKNLDIEVPYVYAHIALDGAGLALHGRIGGIPYDEVRMGLRVEPVWTDGARYPDHYRPTGEPDADYDTYKELL